VVVVYGQGRVHGGEGRGDDRHDVLEILVVCTRVPRGEILGLPLLWTLLDFSEHHWERPQPL